MQEDKNKDFFADLSPILHQRTLLLWDISNNILLEEEHNNEK